MFKIIKISIGLFYPLSMYFYGDSNFLTFINEGFVPLTDENLQTLLIIDIFLL